MKPGFSTRLGAAVRQAGDELVSKNNYRKLLLIISDGEPSDIDVDDAEGLLPGFTVGLGVVVAKSIKNHIKQFESK
jgi:cobalamin biosynthesis protein CobT